MNVELAFAALEDAKANPDRFDMMTFWSIDTEGFVKDTASMTVPPCGTTGCYAGFASLRAAPVGTRIARHRGGESKIYEPGRPGIDTESYAAAALDITSEQAGLIFYLNDIREVETAVRYLADNPDAGYDTLSDVALNAE